MRRITTWAVIFLTYISGCAALAHHYRHHYVRPHRHHEDPPPAKQKMVFSQNTLDRLDEWPSMDSPDISYPHITGSVIVNMGGAMPNDFKGPNAEVPWEKLHAR